MGTRSLTRSEIDGINLYLEEVVNIPMVEAVYLIASFSSKRGKKQIWVMTLFNNSLQYNGKIIGEERVRDIARDSEKLVTCNNCYNHIFRRARLFFGTEDAMNYNLSMVSNQELMAERSLISGTILFDRFGNFEANRQKALDTLEPLEDTFKISNIDAIKFVKTSSLEYIKKSDS